MSFRFLGNTADAEDITQETFVRLWKNISKYRSDVKLTTWLYRIAANLCLDQLKSTRHKNARMTVDTEKAIVTTASADHEVLSREFEDAVRRFANILQPRQKAVYILRELEGLSVEEVGQILSMSSDSIKSNVYHARVQITKWMKEHYGEKKKLQL